MNALHGGTKMRATASPHTLAVDFLHGRRHRRHHATTDRGRHAPRVASGHQQCPLFLLASVPRGTAPESPGQVHANAASMDAALGCMSVPLESQLRGWSGQSVLGLSGRWRLVHWRLVTLASKASGARLSRRVFTLPRRPFFCHEAYDRVYGEILEILPCGRKSLIRQRLAPLAQLDRASVYGTEGYWFESSGVYWTYDDSKGFCPRSCPRIGECG